MQSIKDFLAKHPKATLAITILALALGMVMESGLVGEWTNWISGALFLISTVTGISYKAMPHARPVSLPKLKK